MPFQPKLEKSKRKEKKRARKKQRKEETAATIKNPLPENDMTQRERNGMTEKEKRNKTYRADAPDPGMYVAPGQLARVDEGAEDAEGWGR
jgi:hypothetical protein